MDNRKKPPLDVEYTLEGDFYVKKSKTNIINRIMSRLYKTFSYGIMIFVNN